jgi:uncharacterized protein YdaU (DUF1376 family)
MSETNHNGGPPLDIDAKMRWVRINLSDVLEGIEGLSWEQRGFYLTLLFKMYARQGSLPADDKQGAAALGCNPRTFRLHRDALLAAGKIYIDGDRIKNSRVEREIADFCREVKRRRDAALEREQRRRNASASPSVQPELEANSSPIRPEFDPNSSRTEHQFAANADEIPIEINVCTATALVAVDHNSGGNQKPETRNQKVREEKNTAHSRSSGQSYWAQAMHVDGAFDVNEGVTIEAGMPVLHNGTRAKWLEQFDGNEKLLDLTLTAIARYIQPESTRPIKIQVESQLADRVRSELKQDARYDRAVKRNSGRKSQSDEGDHQRRARIINQLTEGRS